MKLKKSPYTKADFKNDPEFHVDLAVSKAHELIFEIMEKKDVSQAELAKRMKISEPAVSRLLNDDRNFGVAKFAEIMFWLGEELEFQCSSILEQKKGAESIPKYVGNVISLASYQVGQEGTAGAKAVDDDEVQVS
jgi:transcriptional regulator with XRE-family HTH domain